MSCLRGFGTVEEINAKTRELRKSMFRQGRMRYCDYVYQLNCLHDLYNEARAWLAWSHMEKEMI